MSQEQSQLGTYIVLRTWTIAFMIIEFLGFIPVLGIFGFLSKGRFGKDFWRTAAIAWAVLYLFIATCLRSLSCPQCGKNYFGNFLALFGGFVAPGHQYNLFSKECANCELRKMPN